MVKCCSKKNCSEKVKYNMVLGSPISCSETCVYHLLTVPPGPPTPWIVDTGKDSVIVAWKPPLYNGGGDILGYHVEKVQKKNAVILLDSAFPVTKVPTGVTDLFGMNTEQKC